MKNNEGRRVTLRHVSSRSGSYYPNMDIMRYVLSIAVIIAHINYLTGYRVYFPMTSFEAVGGFFAISGFLMYPNFIRHGDTWRYTCQRARRILPPYVFIVVLCTVGLSLVSTLPLSSYFSSSGVITYLGANITFLNWLHPDLPGVFQSDTFITSAVNGSLWTMKVEWCLYFSVPCFVWLLSVMKRVPPYRMALAAIALSIVYRIFFSWLYATTGNEIYNILRRQIFGQLAFFYAGMLIYFIRDFFVRHIWVMLASGIAAMCMLPYAEPTLQAVVEPFSISAIVMALSLLPADIRWLHHRNNISYEMYLFHFPIIQLAIWIGLPSVGETSVLTFVFSTTAALAFAVHVAIERSLRRNRH